MNINLVGGEAVEVEESGGSGGAEAVQEQREAQDGHILQTEK